MARLGKILLFAALLVASGCRYNDFSDSHPDSEVVTPVVNEQLSTLVASCGEEPSIITRDMVVAGRVIANDRSGNFYRTIILDDGSAAVAVRINLYDLHNIYRIGQRVVVDCAGLAIGRADGIVTLGSGIDSWSSYRVDGFSLRSEADRHLFPTADVESPLPDVISTSELNEALCGRLVRLNELRLSPHTTPSATWAVDIADNPYSSVTTRYFYTPAGDSLAVVTSSYADFALEVIPIEPLSLTGILQRGASGTSTNAFSLKLRDSLDYAPF